MDDQLQELLEKSYEYIAVYGLNIVAAIIIFLIGKWIARFISRLVEKGMVKAKLDVTLASFVRNLLYMGLLTFVVIAALSKLGVETTSFVAVIGAAGLAVGLALQGSLSNFAAGVILIIFKPFRVGDYIEGGGVKGTVREIQIFNTILHTLDNKKIVVPNSKMTGDNIINYSGVDKRGVDIVFGISYSDNIQTAKEALERVISADSRILKSPKPLIAVSELGNSSVNILCRPWVNPKDYWGVYFDLTEKGKLELEKSGITIPFPQRDVHIYQEK